MLSDRSGYQNKMMQPERIKRGCTCPACGNTSWRKVKRNMIEKMRYICKACGYIREG